MIFETRCLLALKKQKTHGKVHKVRKSDRTNPQKFGTTMHNEEFLISSDLISYDHISYIWSQSGFLEGWNWVKRESPLRGHKRKPCPEEACCGWCTIAAHHIQADILVQSGSK